MKTRTCPSLKGRGTELTPSFEHSVQALLTPRGLLKTKITMKKKEKNKVSFSKVNVIKHCGALLRAQVSIAQIKVKYFS